MAFYQDMFGWEPSEAMDMGPDGKYQMFKQGSRTIGGMMKKPPQAPQPAWLYYFRVKDIDVAAETVKKDGGQVMMGPMEVPNGEWVFQGVDPQGAVFALFKSAR